MQLKDKVAIITGAGAGIGRACCLLFAAEGAKVVAVDLDSAALNSVAEDVRRTGGTALTIQADVSLAADVVRVVAAVSEKFPAIHILFNNAGIVPHGKIHETTEADWDRTMDVNVKSMYLMSHAVVPIFLKQGGGVILNTSSATAADPEEARKQFVARQPMGRLGTSEEVAKAALFLVSEDARFVTGTAFSIDGGFTV